MVIFMGAVSSFADDSASLLGQSKESEAPFVGIFYDLKQTQDHKPSNVDPETYNVVLDEFLSKGWDESVLNRYYRVTKALATTQIFVPTLNADKAPQAFDVKDPTVKGTRWIAHYKGQVSPPEPGTYRFWGIADDVMAVAVNGKTVLVGNRRDTRLPKTLSTWHPSERDGAHAGDGNLRAGDWITLKADEIIDMDIMVGDRPGGVFNAFLMVEKQGASYNTDRRGHPILPVFQIAPYNTPKGDAEFATGFPTWKSYQ
jgi:hypothetical protein